MNWQAITTGIEIVSLVFILISVFYLGKQVKLANSQSSAESLKDATQLYVKQYKDSFGSRKRVAFMRRALNDYAALSQDEKGCLFAIILGYIGAWDNLHTKYKAGFLDDATYHSITIAFASLVQTPGGFACIKQIEKEFTLPPYIMNNTVAKEIAGFNVRPYTDCLDFLQLHTE